MKANVNDPTFFGEEKVGRILLKIAPPVMLSLLIQALYNIVDSYFVGKFSDHGLTALSVIFPVQTIIIALAVGTGVGVNTLMAGEYARKEASEACKTAGSGIVLNVVSWAVFSVASVFLLKPYISIQTNAPEAATYAFEYGAIVCVGSLGMFLESMFSKIHQAEGNMVVPTIAQIAGAVCNIVFDPILIFGAGKIPAMGVKGAAIATVMGQFLAAAITGVKGFRKIPSPKTVFQKSKTIYKLAYPSIIMQMMFTVYIVVLNVILAKFSDEAVTVLGLYYKIQTFFFIPLTGLSTCIVPVISYNYTRGDYGRVRLVFGDSVLITGAFMVVGLLCFELISEQLLGIFTDSAVVKEIGETAFRIIGSSFLPATLSLMFPVFFQAIGKSKPSLMLTLTRQVFGLMPVFYAFSFIGLDCTWIAFPFAEVLTSVVGLVLYRRRKELFPDALPNS